MKKFLFLLLSVKMYAAPMVFNALLTTANITHTIYHPKDKNIHRPYFSENKLNRRAMVSPIKAIGSGTFLYHPKTNELEYAIAFSGLSSAPVMIHLQVGYPHQDGPIIATIAGQPSDDKSFSFKRSKREEKERYSPENRTGFLTGTVTLQRVGDIHGQSRPIKEEKMLIQGGCYITIHTHLNEVGEIRGQLHPHFLHSHPQRLTKKYHPNIVGNIILLLYCGIYEKSIAYPLFLFSFLLSSYHALFRVLLSCSIFCPFFHHVFF